MSKNRRSIDQSQLTIDFNAKLEAYEEVRKEIMAAASPTPSAHETIDELYIGVAVACKKALRETDLSREQLVDLINGFFAESAEKSRTPLSIHMLNNYLSKPVEYPAPLHVIYALMHITNSLAPIQAFAEAFGCKVITPEEHRQMTLGKLDETIVEMQRLKRELRQGGRKL